MNKPTNILAAAAFVFSVSIATVATTTSAQAFPFFPSWSGLCGLDLGSGR